MLEWQHTNRVELTYGNKTYGIAFRVHIRKVPPMKLVDFPNTEPGCYADGSLGRTAIPHMIQQFADLTDEESATIERYLANDSTDYDDYDAVLDMADEVEIMLNRVLPPNRLAHWHYGEFFISHWCGGFIECFDDECACHD